MKVLDISKETLKELYTKDFPAWVELNLELIRDGLYEKVDWENLTQEIADMGLRHLESCISYMAIILEHMYKLDNFKHLAGGETAGRSWVRSIENARAELRLMLKRYPSLRPKIETEFDYAWDKAVVRLERWLRNNGYNPEDFKTPQKSPYSLQEILEKSYKGDNT